MKPASGKSIALTGFSVNEKFMNHTENINTLFKRIDKITKNSLNKKDFSLINE